MRGGYKKRSIRTLGVPKRGVCTSLRAALESEKRPPKDVGSDSMAKIMMNSRRNKFPGKGWYIVITH